jgi:hypothetical protein
MIKYQMKLACCLLLLLFFVLQSNGLGFRSDSYYNLRGSYTLTCTILGCQTAILNCIGWFKCLGIEQCKKCLHSFPECYSTCANDLFNQDYYMNVNGVKYLPCDDKSAEQVKACELHCRGFLFTYSQCTQLEGFPICKCSSIPIAVSTSPKFNTSLNMGSIFKLINTNIIRPFK